MLFCPECAKCYLQGLQPLSVVLLLTDLQGMLSPVEAWEEVVLPGQAQVSVICWFDHQGTCSSKL
jgi:hypothetical protein